VDLPSNNLDGIIPVEIGNLTNLTSLNLTTNQRSDSVPTKFGNLINFDSQKNGGMTGTCLSLLSTFV
jgi:Leucine-rich repeat (LRR) protein